MLKNQVIPAFLSKTYAIMHNEEYKDIVCWGENGESILILKVCCLVEINLLIFRWTIFLRRFSHIISSMAIFHPL